MNMRQITALMLVSVLFALAGAPPAAGGQRKTVQTQNIPDPSLPCGVHKGTADEEVWRVGTCGRRRGPSLEELCMSSLQRASTTGDFSGVSEGCSDMLLDFEEYTGAASGAAAAELAGQLVGYFLSRPPKSPAQRRRERMIEQRHREQNAAHVQGMFRQHTNRLHRAISATRAAARRAAAPDAPRAAAGKSTDATQRAEDATQRARDATQRAEDATQRARDATQRARDATQRAAAKRAAAKERVEAARQRVRETERTAAQDSTRQAPTNEQRVRETERTAAQDSTRQAPANQQRVRETGRTATQDSTRQAPANQQRVRETGRTATQDSTRQASTELSGSRGGELRPPETRPDSGSPAWFRAYPTPESTPRWNGLKPATRAELRAVYDKWSRVEEDRKAILQGGNALQELRQRRLREARPRREAREAREPRAEKAPLDTHEYALAQDGGAAYNALRELPQRHLREARPRREAREAREPRAEKAPLDTHEYALAQYGGVAYPAAALGMATGMITGSRVVGTVAAGLAAVPVYKTFRNVTQKGLDDLRASISEYMGGK